MNKYLLLAIFLSLTFFLGCEETELPTQVEFRGNPIEELPSDGILRASGSPYLATDTLFVAAGQSLTIEPGVELRFEPGLFLQVEGKITAIGNEAAPIVFTSGQKYPGRGDWDGVWLVDADPGSEFEYCRFMFSAKYGNRYLYTDNGGNLDSTVMEYGSVTLIRSDPTISRCWFELGGFHGVHCDSSSNPVIRNSVFYDNAGHGIYVHETADPDIRYNILVENDDYGIFCKPTPGSDAPRESLELWYNIIWSNFSGEYNQHSPTRFGRISQTNDNLDSCDYQFNLRLDPAFYDPSNSDYRLDACSAAIDAGSEDVERDPDGTRIELGVHHYEYRPGEIRRRIPNLPIVGNHLTAANSPYFMSCGVFVPKGETLYIEAGVEIRVEGRFLLRIAGAIQSEGTAALPVTITSISENQTKGDWDGIVLLGGGDEGSTFKYTNISYAVNGIVLQGNDAEIDNCIIAQSQIFGISCEDLSSPNISNCQLRENSNAGIYCSYNSSPLITNNSIIGGEGYGILALERSLPVIVNNIIADMGTNGIRLENLSSASIINNTISNNGYYGVFCDNNSSPEIRNNIFYMNGTSLRGGIAILAERTSNPIIEYNCFWGHPVSSVRIDNDTTAYDADMNLLEDPRFSSSSGEEFSLDANSPCRDAGDPDPAFNDRDGSRNDLGVYGGPDAL